MRIQPHFFFYLFVLLLAVLDIENTIAFIPQIYGADAISAAAAIQQEIAVCTGVAAFGIQEPV
jgi:hypothetical protein